MNCFRHAIGLLIIILAVLIAACEKKFDEYYSIPDDLIGTILEVLEEEGNYTQFIKAVEMVEYDDVLGKTGNFTVFAPDDNAFADFFAETGYTSLEDLPEEELKGLVFYHIVFWSYSKFKLLYGLGVEDATIEYETDNFKKETRYRLPMVVETDERGLEFTVYHENKFIPVFSDEFFTEQELNAAYDYNFFYPNTTYSGFQADRAEITEFDVPAQNGWIHRINKVLIPPDNHEQILKEREEFSDFYRLVNDRRVYQYNSNYTAQQANEGDIDDDGVLDSLFLKWNSLLTWGYGLDVEDIGGNGQSDMLSVIAPTNNALQNFLDERTSGYGSLDDIGEYWMDWFLSHYFDINYWPSELSSMTEDWDMDLTSVLVNSNLDESDMVYTQMASNGPFYGIDRYILPKAFETAAQPIFGDRDYEWFCELLVHYMVDILINREEIEYTIFAPSNFAMTQSGYSARDGLGGFGLYDNQSPLQPVPRNRATDIVKSHIVFGILESEDFEDGTFLKTIQNTYIGIEDGELIGGEDTQTAGILGPAEGGGSNGVVYKISRFMLSPGRNILNTLTDQVNNPEFDEFHKLLLEAEMILFNEDFQYLAMENISTGIDYTCFIPTNAVIKQARTDGLIPEDKEELKQFLRYHFIEGIVFDDGKQSGTFQTTRFEDEEQNTFSTIEIINEKHNLRVRDNMGNIRQVVSANIQASDGVIHQLDSLLYYK
jgi:uncharacterized surface protein with fasciclin (FAS1) repeats